MSSPMQNTRSSATISSYIASVIASIIVFGLAEFAVPLSCIVLAMDSSFLTGRAACGAALQAFAVTDLGGLVLGLVPGRAQQRRHRNGAALIVDRDERHESGAGVAATAGIQVLALHVDADFDRRAR